MRNCVSVTNLDNSQTGSRGQLVYPSDLKKIKMVSFGFAGESARQNERGRHAITGQRLKTGGYAAIREVDTRSAVQSVELITATGPNTAPGISKQQAATLLAGWRKRLGL